MNYRDKKQIIPLSSGRFRLGDLWRRHKNIHGFNRLIVGCPTMNLGDVFVLSQFVDVVYDNEQIGVRVSSQDKYQANVPAVGDFWRGIYFPGQNARDVELWYGDKLIATWEQVHDLTFNEYLPIMQIISRLVIKWTGNENVLFKYHRFRSKDRLDMDAILNDPDVVWMCDLDTNLNYSISVYMGSCYVIDKRNIEGQ